MTTAIPLTIFPIENDGFHVKLPVKINGKNASFILDTGASKTVLDKNSIEEYIAGAELTLMEQLTSGIGTNSMESHMVIIDQLKIGRILIEHFPCAVLDLQHVNFAYEHLQLDRIVGVLGSDLLVQYNARIDYKRKTLKLDA